MSAQLGAGVTAVQVMKAIAQLYREQANQRQHHREANIEEADNEHLTNSAADDVVDIQNHDDNDDHDDDHDGDHDDDNGAAANTSALDDIRVDLHFEDEESNEVDPEHIVTVHDVLDDDVVRDDDCREHHNEIIAEASELHHDNDEMIEHCRDDDDDDTAHDLTYSAVSNSAAEDLCNGKRVSCLNINICATNLYSICCADAVNVVVMSEGDSDDGVEDADAYVDVDRTGDDLVTVLSLECHLEQLSLS